MSPHRENEAEEAKSVDRGISEFLLRACHDLRAPVRSIRTHAQLLSRDGPATDFKERLAEIADSAQRIERLADGLVNYSLALEIAPASSQHVGVAVLLRTVLARLEKVLSSSEAKVSYGELPRVLADPDRLMQVFEQLLRNAVQSRRQSPLLIQITAEKQGGEWLLAVHDNGIGVEAAYLESIFRPFDRLSGATSEGPGLGLAICRAIVERHGGRIWAESKPGAGSTFFFTLPAE